MLFSATGVLIFMVCLLLGRPLHDIAYFPIQMQVIDAVSHIEHRNKFTYIFNQEFGFYIGRLSGCGLFILLANYVSDTFALRYALLIIGAIQMLSIWFAKRVIDGSSKTAPRPGRFTNRTAAGGYGGRMNLEFGRRVGSARKIKSQPLNGRSNRLGSRIA